MIRIVVVDREGKEHDIECPEGLSVMEALRSLGLGVQGECEGSLACATCHVWVDSAWMKKLHPPSDGEADMLDCAFHVRDTSRLSCQIRLCRALEGLRIEIPG